MFYLSIDVANKSLAISFIQFIKDDLKIMRPNKDIKSLLNYNNQLNNSIKYYICEVVDLIPNKKVKETTQLQRAIALKQFLTGLKNKINNYINELSIEKIQILIELQPSFNVQSRAAYNQIVYEFCDMAIYKIKIMNASYKNSISLHKDLTHSNFIKKYSNNYIANKNHTKENFLYFLKAFNLQYLIKNIKKRIMMILQIVLCK